MSWTAWRLARPAALGSTVLVVVLAGFLLVTGIHLRATLASSGLLSCLSDGGTRTSCSDQASSFYAVVNSLLGGKPVLTYVTLVPGLLGAFIGGPLLARELETGTVRLAWTQSITRTRWLAGRTSIAAAVLVTATVALSTLTTYWRRPVDAVDGRFEPTGYNLEGIVPIGYAVLAFAAGVFAGALLRRSAAAIAVAIGAYLLVHVVVETQLRPRFLAPLTLTYGTRPPATLPSGAGGDWLLQQQVPKPGADLTLYPYSITYQPADRFWTFQAIEFGITLAVAAVLAVLAFAWIRRRRSG